LQEMSEILGYASLPQPLRSSGCGLLHLMYESTRPNNRMKLTGKTLRAILRPVDW
jgi:hypothetical protein